MVAGKTVARKMGIREESRAWIVDAPEGALRALELPPLDWADARVGKVEYIHLFATSQTGLDTAFPGLRKRLARTGALWVSWPKARQLGTDLTLNEVVRIGYGHGLVESTCLGIDATWSALRFTWPKPGKIYRNSHAELTHPRHRHSDPEPVEGEESQACPERSRGVEAERSPP